MTTAKRGLIISVDGADRVGKSTLVDNIMDSMSEEVRFFQFPDPDSIDGRYITAKRKYGKTENEEKRLCYEIGHMWGSVDQILSYIYRGTNVVIDSYVYTAIARALTSRSVSPTWAMSMILGLPAPDVCFILHADPCKINERVIDINNKILEISKAKRKPINTIKYNVEYQTLLARAFYKLPVEIKNVEIDENIDEDERQAQLENEVNVHTEKIKAENELYEETCKLLPVEELEEYQLSIIKQGPKRCIRTLPPTVSEELAAMEAKAEIAKALVGRRNTSVNHFIIE